ncbi:MAG TPA: hypothetical protein VFT37_07970 [Telluria sp.]|nr:hypothetical protein [Telluria sp.]
MVKFIIPLAVLVANLFQSAFADGVAPEMKPFKLPEIATVTIKENGARSPAARQADQGCGGFLLSKRDITDFWRRAGEVSEHDYHHMLDWSPCYASGTLRLKNGMTGIWGIHQYRGGSIKFSDGKTIYLHCPSCKSRPFQPQ